MTKPKSKSKKSDSEKESNNISLNLDVKIGDNPIMSQHSTPSGPSNKLSPSSWFIAEIQAMMHGFGDVAKPLTESAVLIEDIVHQQMTSLLIQASEITTARGSRVLGLEDLLFLLRRDKTKLRRLIRFLELKDIKQSVKGNEEEEGLEAVLPLIKTPDTKSQLKNKRTKLCQDFLSSIDQTEEFMSLFEDDVFDDVKHERHLRAERQSRHMDYAQYIDFCEARQTSFCRKYRSNKFKDWLFQDSSLQDIKLNAIALEILNYLAYETIAQIVDLTLLVKQDASTKVNDPFSRAMPVVCINQDAFWHQINPAKPHGSHPSSPAQSPPSTPTSPTFQIGSFTVTNSMTTPVANQTSGTQITPPTSTPNSSGSVSTTGGSTSKSKAKKRKKSGPGTSLSLPVFNAISPNEIREAIRRYSSHIGPFSVFAKNHGCVFHTRLLSC